MRQWSLVQRLAGAQRGLTATQLCAHCGASRATVYRDLATLTAAGVPVESHTVNGETRHTIFGTKLPPLGPSALQIAALRLARRALSDLEGTTALRELDALLDGYAHAAGASETISLPKARVVAPEIVRKLHGALESRRRTRIRYRSSSARAPEWRSVDPLGLRYAGGHLYFVAHDEKRKKAVPFKLDRISGVDVLAHKAGAHPEVDLDTLFARSAKIWTGPIVEVVVRLGPSVARFAREYPLIADQVLTDEPGGAVLVRARVSGTTEALRWVLGWGKDAEALEPRELREAVQRELAGALDRYGAAHATTGSSPAATGPSRPRSTRSATSAGPSPRASEVE